ncbi:MAG: metallophosphoesterase [Bacteroidales bacterium]|nr:metallophosphoesterase [Bacteroidales bacterium]
MSIYAISDLHLANKVNKEAIINLPEYKDDWIVIAGDIGETLEQLEFTLITLKSKFGKIIWVPGNHDLWTFPLNSYSLKGEEKYNKMVSLCNEHGVLTPEDEYPVYCSDGKEYCVVPIMTLYDYSFKPNNIAKGKEIEWAAESGVICADEDLLFSYPYKSISEWCYIRCQYTEKRLNAIQKDIPIIIINHYPLLKELGKIYTFPRFSIWCGTTLTERWLDQFNIEVAIYGHLHIRSSKIINGVRHEEVSFGYPQDWVKSRGMNYYLRKII